MFAAHPSPPVSTSWRHHPGCLACRSWRQALQAVRTARRGGTSMPASTIIARMTHSCATLGCDNVRVPHPARLGRRASRWMSRHASVSARSRLVHRLEAQRLRHIGVVRHHTQTALVNGRGQTHAASAACVWPTRNNRWPAKKLQRGEERHAGVRALRTCGRRGVRNIAWPGSHHVRVNASRRTRTRASTI